MNHNFFYKNTACNEVVTWVVAQEYLKVTPRDLTVNMIKIDFLNESNFVPKAAIKTSVNLFTAFAKNGG